MLPEIADERNACMATEKMVVREGEVLQDQLQLHHVFVIGKNGGAFGIASKNVEIAHTNHHIFPRMYNYVFVDRRFDLENDPITLKA